MPSVSPLPSGSFRSQVRLKGHKTEGRTFPTEPEALAWGVRREAELLQRTAQTVLDDNHTELTFKEIYNLYIASPVHANKALNTRNREVQASAAVLRLIGVYALSNLDSPTLQKSFFDKRSSEKNFRGKPISGDTLRIEKALVSAVFGFAKKRGLVKFNPLIRGGFDMLTLNKREIRITAEQQAMLIRAAETYIQGHRANRVLLPWLYFILNTGCRPGEAAKIKLTWCDFSKNQISVPRAGQKTRRPRVILLTPFDSFALEQLAEQAEESGSPYLFSSHSKHGFIPYRYYHPWRGILALAGLPADIVPHGARHEFISNLFEKTTLSETQIALLLGDLNPLSLERYKHLRVSALRQQHDDYSSALREVTELAYNQLGYNNGRVVK
jgi:integrase